jgi:hypothetical protein
MGLLKVHYTASRRAVYLDFAKNSGRSGHFQSGLLIQCAYEKTAVFAGYIKLQDSDFLLVSKKTLFTAF